MSLWKHYLEELPILVGKGGDKGNFACEFTPNFSKVGKFSSTSEYNIVQLEQMEKKCGELIVT